MTEKAFKNRPLFHTAGAGKLLTTDFASGDEFYIGKETELTLIVTFGGSTIVSCYIQIEVSYDGKANWEIIKELPDDGVLEGSISRHRYPIILQPDLPYRISAKRDGGDVDSTALILGTTRIPQAQGATQANKDCVPPAYSSDDNADRVKVTNQWNKYFHGGPLIDATDIPDTTPYYTPWMDMDGVRDLSIQLTIDGSVSVKVFGSNKDDGAPPADGGGEDIGLAVFGAATFTSSGFMFNNQGIKVGCIKWIQLEYTTSGGATGDNLKVEPRGID